MANVALPFYFDAWQPEVTLLAALGIVQVARSATAAGRRLPVRAAAALLATAAVGVLGTAAVRTSAETARLHPHGIARLARVLDAHGVDRHGTVLVTGFYPWEPQPYLPPRTVVRSIPADPGRVDAIAIHPARPRTPQNRAVLALVAANTDRLSHVPVDTVDLYLVTAPLRRAEGG